MCAWVDRFSRTVWAGRWFTICDEEVLPPTPLNDFQGRPLGREALYLDPNGVRVVLFELLDRDND